MFLMYNVLVAFHVDPWVLKRFRCTEPVLKSSNKSLNKRIIILIVNSVPKLDNMTKIW